MKASLDCFMIIGRLFDHFDLLRPNFNKRDHGSGDRKDGKSLSAMQHNATSNLRGYLIFHQDTRALHMYS